jgi:DNA-binding response OmpR family regulator
MPDARILVIDDDRAVRALVGDLLAGLGYAADEGEDAATGLALLARQRYDLVITDLAMPHMSGWEVVELVRHRAPGTAVLIISGFATEDDVGRAQRMGIRILHKPFSVADLRHATEEAIRQANMAQPPAQSAVCPVCQRPLAEGGTLLYQGAERVHARCWRDTASRPRRPSEAGPGPGTETLGSA